MAIKLKLDCEDTQNNLGTKQDSENMHILFAKMNSDLKNLTISSDSKYLICSTVQEEKTYPAVFVWDIEKTLESKTQFASEYNAEKLEAHTYNVKKIQYLNDNWILSIDSLISEINGEPIWVIVAGGILGEVYVWCGPIDKNSKRWNFADHVFQVLSFDFNYSQPLMIQTIKILKDPQNPNDFDIYAGIYDVNDNLNIVNGKKNYPLYKWNMFIEKSNIGWSIVERDVIKQPGTLSHDDGISSITYCSYCNSLYTASWDGCIIKWNLNNNTNNLIGDHKSAVNKIVCLNLGKQIASAGSDGLIKIWELDEKYKDTPPRALTVLKIPLVDIDSQKGKKNEKILLSISKDNILRIWDIWHATCTKFIDLDAIEYKDLKDDLTQHEIGDDFVTKIIVSPNNEFVFIVKKNLILLFYRHGLIMDNYVRHFSSQLDYIKEEDPEFYNKIIGENLRQLASESNKDEYDIMYEIYRLILRRLGMATGRPDSDYVRRLLGTIFIPYFVKFEREEDPLKNGGKEKDKIFQDNLTKRKHQKEYITSVRTRYANYWQSVRDMFLYLPNEDWKFNLYVTTDISCDIKEAKWYNVVDPKDNKEIEILMKDRQQIAIRFLLVLDNVPTTLMPVIKSINIDVEDCRGDTSTLIFSDFVYSEDFLNRDSRKLNLENIYYSDCIFKIDGDYKTEDYATITIRKISAEFEEILNPFQTAKSSARDKAIFDSFRDNFLSPHIPPFKIKIGKGFMSALGKKADEFLSKIILIGVIFTFTDILEILSEPILDSIWGILRLIFGIAGFGILMVILLVLLKRKK